MALSSDISGSLNCFTSQEGGLRVGAIEGWWIVMIDEEGGLMLVADGGIAFWKQSTHLFEVPCNDIFLVLVVVSLFAGFVTLSHQTLQLRLKGNYLTFKQHRNLRVVRDKYSAWDGDKSTDFSGIGLFALPVAQQSLCQQRSCPGRTSSSFQRSPA